MTTLTRRGLIGAGLAAPFAGQRLAKLPAMSMRSASGPIQGTLVSDVIIQSNTAAAGNALIIPHGGASTPVFSGVIGSPAYLASLAALYAPGAPDVPVVKIAATWKDRAGGVETGSQHWFPTVTNVSPAVDNVLVTGKGPTEGNELIITARNLSASLDITLDFSLQQWSRNVPARHDWRNVSHNILGAYTYGGETFSTPVSDCTANILGYGVFIGLTPLATQSRLNGLYAGESQLAVQLDTSTSSGVTVIVQGIQPEFAAPLVPVFEASFTNTVFVDDLTLPRTPSIISFVNNDPSTTVHVTYSLVPKEFAS